MRLNRKLLLIAALFLLVLPLMYVGNAGALTHSLVGDGSAPDATGKIAITDPGFCNNVPAVTTRTACTGTVLAIDETACKAAACTDGVSADAETCNAAGYAWNTYGDWKTGACSDPLYITSAACTAAGKTWDAVATSCRGKWVFNQYYVNAGFCVNPDYTVEADCNNSGSNWYATNRGGNGGPCLHCHNTRYLDGDTAHGGTRDNFAIGEFFPMTGHKNVMRKVTPGIPMGGPSFSLGEAGSAAYTGMDWDTGKNTSNGLNDDVLFIYNSWFRDIKVAQLKRTTIADPTTVSQVSIGSQVRGCMYCHTTGYGETEAALIGVGTSTKWQITGIVCGSCHKNQPFDNLSSGHGNANNIQFEEGTMLCMTCHRYESTAGPITSDAVQAGALVIEEIGPNHANFGGQFLNSPHAKFTGTWGQIIDRSQYSSHFDEDAQGCSDSNTAYRTKALCTTAGKTWYGCSDSKFFTPASCTANGKTWQAFVGAAAGVASTTTVARNAGCNGCHDPHFGGVDPDVLDPLSELSQIKEAGTCGTSCHSTKLTAIKHPSGPGTPMDQIGTSKGDMFACVTCHMGPTISHFWRINTSATYETFDHVAGAPNTYDDGGYAAVGLDVDMACGQCHGGGTDPVVTPSKAGIMYFDKATLSVYATGMHTGAMLPPTVGHDTITNGSPATRTVSFTDTSADGNYGAQSSLSITVNWGDGQVSTGVGGGLFSHTYNGNGVFNIVHTATDSGNRAASELIPVTVNKTVTGTAEYTLTVTVTPVTGSGAYARVYLKKTTLGLPNIVRTAYANASGEATFTKLPAATYEVYAYKSGVDLDAKTGIQSTSAKKSIVISADDTLAIP